MPRGPKGEKRPADVIGGKPGQETRQCCNGSDVAGKPNGWRKPTPRPYSDHGAEAYREARQREREAILPAGTTYAGRRGAVEARPTRRGLSAPGPDS